MLSSGRTNTSTVDPGRGCISVRVLPSGGQVFLFLLSDLLLLSLLFVSLLDCTGSIRNLTSAVRFSKSGVPLSGMSGHGTGYRAVGKADFGVSVNSSLIFAIYQNWT